MTIKGRINDVAWATHDRLQCEAQARYLQYIMKEENVSYEEAFAIATGRTDPKEPEYTLGYKLADPVLNLALFKSSKKTRAGAIENFERLLDPEELVLFRSEVLKESHAENFKKSYKNAKKN